MQQETLAGANRLPGKFRYTQGKRWTHTDRTMCLIQMAISQTAYHTLQLAQGLQAAYDSEQEGPEEEDTAAQ